MSFQSENREVVNYLLVKLFNRILGIEEKALSSSEFADVTMTGIHVIEAIGLEGDRQMTAIAAALGVTAGTLTHTVNSLVRKGYVRRVNADHDKRVFYLRLTDRGAAAYRRHHAFHEALVTSALGGMGAREEEALIGALNRIVDFFERQYEESR